MSKTKRISLITLLVTLILSMLALIVMGVGQKQAYASEPTLFAFEDGASVKIIEDGGMRFRLQMDETTASEIKGAETNELSFYVVPEKYYEENMTVIDLENLLFENCGSNKAQKVVADKNKIYKGVDTNGNDGWFANCLLDINLSKYNNAYNTVNFIVFASWNGNLVESEIRNLRDVASSAALDEYYDEVTNTYTWLGSEQYALSVDTLAEYQALQAKVSAGLETDLHFNIYNKFTSLAGGKIENRENLPKNTTFYHYVRYYDKDTITLLDMVEVKEGEAATTSASNEYEVLDYGNGCIWNYYINSWTYVANTQSFANLSQITENKRVFAYYGARERIDQTLLAEASAANPDVALFLSERFGFTQLGDYGSNNASIHDYVAGNREYHPDMEYDGFKGMTSYTVENTACLDARMIFKIKINENFTYNTGDYVMFYVKPVIQTTTTNTTLQRAAVRCNNANTGYGVWCDNEEWTKVVYPAEYFANSDYLSFGAFGTSNVSTDVYTYYISNVVRVSGDEVKNVSATDVESDYTYKVGDVTLVGPANKYVWTSNPHATIGDFGKNVYYVQGSLMYNDLEGKNSTYTSCILGLEFETALSGKVYMIAKGLAVDGTHSAPGVQAMVAREQGTTSWREATKVKNLDDGFAIWAFDFGENSYKYIRLWGYGQYYRQIVISSISTTNPAA
ncbi:MAG: hypothetical protein E7346_05115 [Clostridiales bacterium]|nr:hypothetical protein [Clostridiales bacterium]